MRKTKDGTLKGQARREGITANAGHRKSRGCKSKDKMTNWKDERSKFTKGKKTKTYKLQD
jgi:hypothetical protein